jgi:DNA-binding protein HU-beta
MNKRDLARAVAVQADVELSTVSTVLESFTDVVTAVVSKGEPVSIPGFAKFVKVDRPARMGRNPATGEAIRIKASKKARITPVKAFKEAVISPGNAPRLKRGVWPTEDTAVKAAGRVPALATPRKAVTARKPAARKVAKAVKSARGGRAATARTVKRTVASRSTAKKSPARKAPAKRRAR